MNDFIAIATRMIPENEGKRLKVYDDATGKELKKGDTLQGYPSIGIGRNLIGKGLNDDEVKILFVRDRADAVREIQAQKFSFWDALSDIRKAVLVDLVFNMGMKSFLGFKKMIRAFQMGDYFEAALQLQDSNYYQQTGDRAKRNYNMMKYNRYFELGEAA